MQRRRPYWEVTKTVGPAQQLVGKKIKTLKAALAEFELAKQLMPNFFTSLWRVDPNTGRRQRIDYSHKSKERKTA